MLSKVSGERNAGRDCDNDPAHMRKMFTNLQKCYFLIHIDFSLHQGILILHPESSKCKNFEIIGIYTKFKVSSQELDHI